MVPFESEGEETSGNGIQINRGEWGQVPVVGGRALHLGSGGGADVSQAEKLPLRWHELEKRMFDMAWGGWTRRPVSQPGLQVLNKPGNMLWSGPSSHSIRPGPKAVDG